MYAILINYLGRYSKVFVVLSTAAVVLFAAQFLRENTLPGLNFSIRETFSSKQEVSKDISSSDISTSSINPAKVIDQKEYNSDKSELEKLLNTIDLAKNQKVDIIFDGRNYTPFEMKIWARQYLKRNFEEGETAVEWVEKNTYRTEEGNIIYFRYKDGSQRPMRDVFLELLQTGQVT